jgi:hypothetical protein
MVTLAHALHAIGAIASQPVREDDVVDWGKYDDDARHAVQRAADEKRRQEEARRVFDARAQEIARSHVARLLAANVPADVQAIPTHEGRDGKSRSLWHIGDFQTGFFGSAPHYVDRDGLWWLRAVNKFDPNTGRWWHDFAAGATTARPPWTDLDQIVKELAKLYWRSTSQR